MNKTKQQQKTISKKELKGLEKTIKNLLIKKFREYEEKNKKEDIDIKNYIG